MWVSFPSTSQLQPFIPGNELPGERQAVSVLQSQGPFTLRGEGSRGVQRRLSQVAQADTLKGNFSFLAFTSAVSECREHKHSGRR